MVWSWVRAWARTERRYRLLSCPGSAASAAAAEQLGAAHVSGAASAARSRKEQLGSPLQQQQEQQQQQKEQQQQQEQQQSSSSRQKGHTVITVNTKIVGLIKGNAQTHLKKNISDIFFVLKSSYFCICTRSNNRILARILVYYTVCSVQFKPVV